MNKELKLILKNLFRKQGFAIRENGTDHDPNC